MKSIIREANENNVINSTKEGTVMEAATNEISAKENATMNNSNSEKNNNDTMEVTTMNKDNNSNETNNKVIEEAVNAVETEGSVPNAPIIPFSGESGFMMHPDYCKFKMWMDDYDKVGRNEDKLIGNIGYSADYAMDPDEIVMAVRIIGAVIDYRINDLIELSGMDQTAFERKYTIPHDTLNSWISGENKVPVYILALLGYAVFTDYRVYYKRRFEHKVETAGGREYNTEYCSYRYPYI